VMRTLRLFSLLLSIAIIISFLPSNPYALILTLPPVGICMAVVITNGALLISNSVSHQLQGLAIGALTSVEVLAEIFTGLIGGPLAASFYQLPLYFGAGMAGICFLILILSIRNGNNNAKLKRG
jgi:predicted MFS family arabinose efflux permease